jgi:hypothetical protein
MIKIINLFSLSEHAFLDIYDVMYIHIYQMYDNVINVGAP